MRTRFCAFLVIATSFYCSFANSTPEVPEFAEKEPVLTVGAVDDSLPCSVKVDGVFKGFLSRSGGMLLKKMVLITVFKQ